jgi:hypothetical protein
MNDPNKKYNATLESKINATFPKIFPARTVFARVQPTPVTNLCNPNARPRESEKRESEREGGVV